jgi:protein tyrosine/serine phosphatase
MTIRARFFSLLQSHRPSIGGQFRGLLLITASVAMLSIASYADPDRKEEKGSSTTVQCENFGKVTDFYYRGAQPEREEYSQLAGIGVKTIIDLRDDPKSYAREKATLAGMKYINLPMSDSHYPAEDTATKFLNLVNDKANWPVYVHCAGGRHRTGAMTAVFRMETQGWNIERAYDEMKDYDFYTRFGHKSMKRFVYDYYRDKIQRRETQIADQSKR